VLEGRCVPSTLTVRNTKDHGSDSLRGAIAAAQSGDTIVISPKLAGQTITLTSGELDITKSLTIQGPAPGQGHVIVSGDQYGDSRVFEVGANVVVTLSGLSITNGYARFNGDPSHFDGRGGGIKNEGTLTVSNCTLWNNVADSGGGGIYNTGMLTVTGCVLDSNRVNGGDGGGIFNDFDATLTVSNSTLENNFAYPGDVSFGGSSRGGGIADYGTATVSGCQFTENGAEYGGAIDGGTLTISNSTFSGNGTDTIDGSYTDGGGNTFS
jgi:predicted outer membrane repeat protein